MATQINRGALSSLQVLSVTTDVPFTPSTTLSKDGDIFKMEKAWVPSFVMQVKSLVQLENAKSLYYLQVRSTGKICVTCKSKRLGPAEWLPEAEGAGEMMEMRWTRRMMAAKALSTTASVEV